ncbi:MAG: TraB/GumN family protein [Bacteroidota bacterium]
MKIKWLGLVLTFLGLSCQSQPALEKAPNSNTLLWEISGKGLKQPSYFFGTMHMLCPEDAKLSSSMQQVLNQVKALYFEVDMDDMMQMFGSLKAMNMKNGTRLHDLLSPEEYARVKSYFEKKSPLPFTMMENYKPMLLSGMIEEQQLPCKSTNGMEMVILEQSNKLKLAVNGLETMEFQAGLFDSIPYQDQANELVKAIDSMQVKKGSIDTLLQTYRSQNLAKIEELTSSDEGEEAKYLDLLLFKRNRNWVAQFDTIAAKGSTLFAVGAGHLPGDQGVLELLRKKGFTVTPLKN